MSTFYPPYLRQRFTDRAHELSVLASVAQDLRDGHPRHVALFGLRRIGKTLLAQEQVVHLLDKGDVAPVYLDMEGICSAPEPFAQRYVGLTCYWVLAEGEGPVEAYLTADRLLETQAAEIPLVARTVGALVRELGRRKPDYTLLLKLAFDFPEQLAQAVDRPIMCFLDEFPELASLGNFPGVGDPLKHFRASLQQQSRVAYVITGSAVTAMERLVRDHESPLFLQFRALELQPFTQEDTQRLVERMFGPLPPPAQSAVYTYTFGHPFYVTALVERLRDLAPAPEGIEVEQVEHAFLLETLSRQGQIYGYCRYLYDISLQKARGYGLLKALLQILAEEEGLALSELASRLRRQASATREYLRWLMEVDLVIEEEKRYYYRDPVLRFWVAYTSQGVEVDAFPRREDLEGLVSDLSERFQRVSSQLGQAKESEVRELLRKLAGQTAETSAVDGELFGQEAPVRIPDFARVERYLSPDGQVELDALAEADTARWVVEVKWRMRRVGKGELERLVEHAEQFEARAWCVSQAGFTPEAVGFAAEHDVLLSGADELKALEKLVG
jgi:AAA+ ATPase superfamily predicted ATPase